MQYAGFWHRFGAFWLDTLIMLPIMGLTFWGHEQARLFQLYWLLPGLAFGVWFHLYLVAKYGGTPGKLLLNIKVVKLDGSNVGYKEASLRYSVLFTLSFLMSVLLIPPLFDMTDQQYFSMDFLTRSAYLVEQTSGLYEPINIVMQIWIWGEFLVMLTNKKRRALHDFMAGTVVIRKADVEENSPDTQETTVSV
jgi:uncharacterized RDD family membrane protein YckC